MSESECVARQPWAVGTKHGRCMRSAGKGLQIPTVACLQEESAIGIPAAAARGEVQPTFLAMPKHHTPATATFPSSPSVTVVCQRPTAPQIVFCNWYKLIHYFTFTYSYRTT